MEYPKDLTVGQYFHTLFDLIEKKLHNSMQMVQRQYLDLNSLIFRENP